MRTISILILSAIEAGQALTVVSLATSILDWDLLIELIAVYGGGSISYT